MHDKLAGCDILVIEDEFLILMDLKHMLETSGANVITATRIEDAMKYAEKDFCAAILDVRLPDGDVYPLANQLKKRRVPIIFHSGHAHASELSSLYPDAAVLEKPANQNELLGTVIAWSHRKGANSK